MNREKGGGRPTEVDEATRKLLEGDVHERPAATASEGRRFLERLSGKASSDSTMRRVLKRLGFGQKNGLWGRWDRMGGWGLCPEGAGGGAQDGGAKAPGVRRRRGGNRRFALTLARLVASRRAGTP